MCYTADHSGSYIFPSHQSPFECGAHWATQQELPLSTLYRNLWNLTPVTNTGLKVLFLSTQSWVLHSFIKCSLILPGSAQVVAKAASAVWHTVGSYRATELCALQRTVGPRRAAELCTLHRPFIHSLVFVPTDGFRHMHTNIDTAYEWWIQEAIRENSFVGMSQEPILRITHFRAIKVQVPKLLLDLSAVRGSLLCKAETLAWQPPGHTHLSG